ncbi:hypothetical protein HHI36_024392 [Cryptolaemus montrouzieri]|uniref:DUF8207 domain-containing protein n=1 Tax=Cryptolaemus montrouzieri TaxID=559131 RepID=A0ABD2NPL5_9CUCU
MEQSFIDFLEQYDKLPRKYIEGLIFDEQNKDYDHKYDIENEKFFVGNSEMKIDGNDLVIQNKRYKGTPGLYELLFKRNPRFYTTIDEKAFRSIILKTNAHKRHSKRSDHIDGSTLKKYEEIIAPLGRTIYSGAGVSGNV